MASDTQNSGHIAKGGIVTREDRPPGPVPMHHSLKLGSKTVGTTAPYSDGPISKVPSVKGGW